MTKSITTEKKKETINAFRKKFGVNASYGYKLNGEFADVEAFLSKSLSDIEKTVREETAEYAIKVTISKFLQMNIENPKLPVNIDEVKRRAINHLRQASSEKEKND